MSTSADLAMPFLLASAFRGLVDAVHDELADQGHPGVRSTHGFAMQAIGNGCTTVQLGQRLGVTKQAAAKTAGALEGMGLIRRMTSTRDGRERLLTPTTRGQEMLRLSAVAFAAQVQNWRTQVGDDAVDATLRTLAAVSPSRAPNDPFV